MRLTKKKAIEISIELWAWLAETGNPYKYEWEGWQKYGEMAEYCALCEYDKHHADNCSSCPYWRVFGDCNDERGKPYREWICARSPKEHKQFATEFLEQLKQLQSKK